MITVYDAVDLDFKRHLDDPYGLDTKLPADFKKERHIEDDNGMAFILRAVKLLLRAVPDIRMNDVVQLLPFLFICKNDLGVFRRSRVPSSLKISFPKTCSILAMAWLPGVTASRASLSPSITGIPSVCM